MDEQTREFVSSWGEKELVHHSMRTGGTLAVGEDRRIGIGDDLARCGIDDHQLFFDSKRYRNHPRHPFC